MLANLSTQRRKEMIKISTLLLRKQENIWWFDQAKKTFLSFLRKKFSRNISEKKDAPENNRICYGWLSTK